MHDRSPSLDQRITRLEVRIDERDTERFAHIDQRFGSIDTALQEVRSAIQGLTWWAGGLILGSWVTIMVTILFEGHR